MAGIIARTRAISRSRREDPVVDNYVSYLARIEEAQGLLRAKLDRNQSRIRFYSAQLNVEESIRGDWAKRVTAIESALECYDGEPRGYEDLSRLLNTARSMHKSFDSRCGVVAAAIDNIRGEDTPLLTHINQLSASKSKLQSAQSLELARGTMDEIMASTPSSHSLVAIPGRETQEMRSIRLLIAESEALAELKG